MLKSFRHGHPIIWKEKKWVYEDNEIPIEEENRSCAYCEKQIEEYDPCLGKLPGVASACCGHGQPKRSHIMFENGVLIQGFNVIINCGHGKRKLVRKFS